MLVDYYAFTCRVYETMHLFSSEAEDRQKKKRDRQL